MKKKNEINDNLMFCFCISTNRRPYSKCQLQRKNVPCQDAVLPLLLCFLLLEILSVKCL